MNNLNQTLDVGNSPYLTVENLRKSNGSQAAIGKNERKVNYIGNIFQDDAPNSSMPSTNKTTNRRREDTSMGPSPAIASVIASGIASPYKTSSTSGHAITLSPSFPSFTHKPQFVHIFGKSAGGVNYPTLTAEGQEFLGKHQNLKNLHIVTITGKPKIGKSTLLSKLFGEPGEIQLKTHNGDEKKSMAILGHLNIIQDAGKNILLMNLEGAQSWRLSPKKELARKQSCLYFAFVAMTSSVIIYVYDTKLSPSEQNDLDYSC